MQNVFRFFLALHVIGGSAAIVLGLTALASPKPMFSREAHVHRRMGRAFDYSMRFVIGGAIVMSFLHFRPYLVALTASAGILAFSGVRVLRRKRPTDRATLLDWFVTSIVFAAGLHLVYLFMNGRVRANAGMTITLAILSIVYAAWDFWRFVFPAGSPFTKNLWLYEHMVKMTFALFAAVAAFSGNALVMIPQPWRQMWPTLVGNLITMVLLFRYVRATRLRNDGTLSPAQPAHH